MWGHWFYFPTRQGPFTGARHQGKNSNLIDHYGLLNIYEGALTHKLLLYSKPAGVLVLNGGGGGMHNRLMLYVTVYFLVDAFSVCARKTNIDWIKWHRDLDFFSFFFLSLSGKNLQPESSEKNQKKAQAFWERERESAVRLLIRAIKNSDWNWMDTIHHTIPHREDTRLVVFSVSVSVLAIFFKCLFNL